MAFQYPVEIPGISNAYFLRAALNAVRKYRGQEELDAMDFLPLLKEKMRLLEMDERFLNRPVNEGFFGRREENGMRSCRWPCSSRRWRSSTRPIPGSILTR